MNTTEIQCQNNAHKVLSALPASAGFSCRRMDENIYEIANNLCVIRLSFERYEPSSVVVEIIDPKKTSALHLGMSLWILRQIRGVPLPREIPDRFRWVGLELATNFPDLLAGDFLIQREYDRLKSRILDRSLDVQRLPMNHPTRILFENADLRWLNEIERVV